MGNGTAPKKGWPIGKLWSSQPRLRTVDFHYVRDLAARLDILYDAICQAVRDGFFCI